MEQGFHEGRDESCSLEENVAFGEDIEEFIVKHLKYLKIPEK